MSSIELPPSMSALANPSATNVEHPPVTKDMTLAQILASCESTMPISIQSAYAGMQLAQAKLCKEQSQNKMEAVQQIQERQSKITALIAKCREEKANNGGVMSEETFNAMKALGLSTDPNALEEGWYEIKPGPEMDKMIDEMQKAWDRSPENSDGRKWMDDWLPALRKARSEGKSFSLNGQNKTNLQNAMSHCGNDTWNTFKSALKAGSGEEGHKAAPQNENRWEFNLKSMTNYQEQVGAKTQSTMVSLQDIIGQYNAYLQGANAAIDRANQLLAKLASGQQ